MLGKESTLASTEQESLTHYSFGEDAAAFRWLWGLPAKVLLSSWEQNVAKTTGWLKTGALQTQEETRRRGDGVSQGGAQMDGLMETLGTEWGQSGDTRGRPDCAEGRENLDLSAEQREEVK